MAVAELAKVTIELAPLAEGSVPPLHHKLVRAADRRNARAVAAFAPISNVCAAIYAGAVKGKGGLGIVLVRLP